MFGRTTLSRIAVAQLLATTLAFAACGDDDDPPEPTSGPSVAATQGPATQLPGTEAPLATGDITVFAAASLTSAFEDIGTAFEAANAGASVTFNFAGSPSLRTQLTEGADADIYVSADTNNMTQALEADLVVDEGVIFTQNRLAVIVPTDNPANITTLQDLSRDGVKLVLTQPDVPVGSYARESLLKMQAEGSFGATFSDDVLANLVSEEPNVKAIVTKVQLGEADAGIVYVTDVTADVAADVTIIEIPDALNIIATYPIAVTTNANNVAAAEAFIAFVLSEDGQAILEQYGFQSAE